VLKVWQQHGTAAALTWTSQTAMSVSQARAACTPLPCHLGLSREVLSTVCFLRPQGCSALLGVKPSVLGWLGTKVTAARQLQLESVH